MTTVVALVFLVGCLVALGALLFVRGERRRGRSMWERAVRLEADGDPEGACFCYAVAIGAGVDRAACEARIRALWEGHGPFEFDEISAKLKAEYCRYESCGQGFHALVVGNVRRIVEAERAAGSRGRSQGVGR